MSFSQLREKCTKSISLVTGVDRRFSNPFVRYTGRFIETNIQLSGIIIPLPVQKLGKLGEISASFIER